MASQEVSKPVLIGVIVAAVLLIGFIGWWFFLRAPAATSGLPGAPPGMGGQGMPGGPGGGPPGGTAPAPR